MYLGHVDKYLTVYCICFIEPCSLINNYLLKNYYHNIELAIFVDLIKKKNKIILNYVFCYFFLLFKWIIIKFWHQLFHDEIY